MIFNGNNIQAGLINHICLSFAVHTFILHRRRRRSPSSSIFKPTRVGSGGCMTPSPPLKSFVYSSDGAGGAVWVSIVLMVLSILTMVMVACRFNRLVFQPPRHLCAMSVGGYCRLSSCSSDILTNMM